MKKNTIYISSVTALAAGLLFLASCQKTDYITFDPTFTGIYFQEDSIYYSFGVTPLEVHSYDLKVPVRIMGEAAKTDRHFSVTVLPEKTTAVEGVNYTIADSFTLEADSINGYIPVTILRDHLEDDDFKLYLKLEETGDFKPVNEQYKETIIHFNNKVEPPTWKDYAGRPTWPSYQLGSWNPLTYIKFIELFRELEEKAPDSYYAMVALFGPDLKSVTYGWAYDYDYTLKKFVLIPLYQYFMEQHPELGVVIPRPSGY